MQLDTRGSAVAMLSHYQSCGSRRSTHGAIALQFVALALRDHVTKANVLNLRVTLAWQASRVFHDASRWLWPQRLRLRGPNQAGAGSRTSRPAQPERYAARPFRGRAPFLAFSRLPAGSESRFGAVSLNPGASQRH